MSIIYLFVFHLIIQLAVMLTYKSLDLCRVDF